MHREALASRPLPPSYLGKQKPAVDDVDGSKEDDDVPIVKRALTGRALLIKSSAGPVLDKEPFDYGGSDADNNSNVYNDMQDDGHLDPDVDLDSDDNLGFDD